MYFKSSTLFYDENTIETSQQGLRAKLTHCDYHLDYLQTTNMANDSENFGYSYEI